MDLSPFIRTSRTVAPNCGGNNKMVRFTIHDLALALLALTCCFTGCQSMKSGGWKPSAIAKKLDPRDGLPWNRKDEAHEGNPARIVATWSDTVLHKEGEPATRGFGGKIYFYDNKDTDPIKVKGQLIVYAFDETNRVPTDNCPTRRFVFPPEEVAIHESDSDLGVGYSFWLPWDGTEGPSTEVSLIARFEPLKGGVLVVSDQSRTRLPGRISPTTAPGESLIATQPSSNVPGVSGVQVASGELTTKFTVEQATNLQPVTAAPLRKMQTTSISLPEGFRPSGKGLIPERKTTPRAGRTDDTSRDETGAQFYGGGAANVRGTGRAVDGPLARTSGRRDRGRNHGPNAYRGRIGPEVGGSTVVWFTTVRTPGSSRASAATNRCSLGLVTAPVIVACPSAIETRTSFNPRRVKMSCSRETVGSGSVVVAAMG